MKPSTLAKLERMKKALSYQQPDRVPIGDFFWTGFMNSCRKKYGADFNPYTHWDLDYSFAIPNMDPKIQPFEVIHEKGDDILIKTGFGATIRRTGELPMPHYDSFFRECARGDGEIRIRFPQRSEAFLSRGRRPDQLRGRLAGAQPAAVG